MTPSQLDAQSPVHVDEWIDFYSPKAKEIDRNPKKTFKTLESGFRDNLYSYDALGRIWTKIEGGKFSPFYLQFGDKLYGYRFLIKAMN